MLKQRIITALILVPLVLWALFGLKDDHLIILFAAILLAGALEWLKLSEMKQSIPGVLFILLQIFLVTVIWWIAELKPDLTLVILTSIGLVWLLIFFWLALYEKGIVTSKLNKLTRLILGLLLLPACLLGISFILKNFQNDRIVILLLFILIWGADIAAYFSGKAFGKHKLAPHISPGKSWEGVIGALAGTIVITIMAGIYAGYPLQKMPAMALFFVTVVVLSVVGDLFESLLKRQVGLKDSGNILPGHGGVLDRIDSLIAASPVYALGMYLLGIQ